MRFSVTTKNEFYDGWVAWILGLSAPRTSSEAFLEGWKMADETAGPMTSGVGKGLILDGLHAEIDRGRVVVKMEAR